MSLFSLAAKFWVRRFQDIWDSCSHKKAVAAAIGFLVLNLSSPVARIWEGEDGIVIFRNLAMFFFSLNILLTVLWVHAVFMLYVAFRCYQQSAIRDDWVEDEAGGEETS